MEEIVMGLVFLAVHVMQHLQALSVLCWDVRYLHRRAD